MDDDKILELTGKIEETLGAENYAMISDTVGEILTGNASNMKAIAERDDQIKTLEDRNEKLVLANGSLLQKVSVAQVKTKTEEKEEKPKKINLKDAFDAKGNFVR